MPEQIVKVEPNKVVSFHYRASDNGNEVDSSHARGAPLLVLIGHGSIIPGLEKALMGHGAGDRLQVSVPPEEAYGEHRPGWTQRVPKKYFQQPERLRPGSVTTLSSREAGPRQVVVLKVGSSVIDVDFNHPLAGRTLDFEVEITDVRDATAEEIAHRHAHGPHTH